MTTAHRGGVCGWDDGYAGVPLGCGLRKESPAADANIRIPAGARDRLAEVAQSQWLSLRAYLARLADTVLTPAERAQRAETATTVLRQWSGYDPDAAQQQALDAELDHRLGRPAA